MNRYTYKTVGSGSVCRTRRLGPRQASCGLARCRDSKAQGRDSSGTGKYREIKRGGAPGGAQRVGKLSHCRTVCLLALLAAVFAVGCSGGSSSSDGFVLLFDEREPGFTEFSQTRMLVTADFLRIDDGSDGNDFLLFDRQTRAIYNVSAEDQTVLVIEPLPIDISAPERFEHDVEKTLLKEAPKIDGRPVQHVILSTNGERCYELYAVAGLLEAPRTALAEFYQTLAGEQAVVVGATPPEFQSDCQLANDIFLPDRHLRHGFPIRSEDMNGRLRIMADYRTDWEPQSALFELPADYRRYSPAEMRL